MKPIDYREATFSEIKGRLHGDRLTVLEALQLHGPTTTRNLARTMEWDILSVRPRVTELVQLGLAEIVPDSQGRPAREGLYRALTTAEAEALFHFRQQAVQDPQGTFELA